MRVDNLSPEDKVAYNIFIKNQRIHQSELTTERTDVEFKYRAKLEEVERQERRQKEEAKQKELEAKQKLAKTMLKYNEPIEVIIKETGLSEQEIQEIK